VGACLGTLHRPSRLVPSGETAARLDTAPRAGFYRSACRSLSTLARGRAVRGAAAGRPAPPPDLIPENHNRNDAMQLVLAAGLLEPASGLIVWKALAFAILLFVLYRYAWGPVTESLKEREEKIDSSIRRAEKALQEAKQIQAENDKARREAEREAQRILREARESAEDLKQREKDKMRQEIQQMQEQARQEIEREKQGALQELRDEVADLAVQAATKIVKEDLDNQRQRKLVHDFIEDLPQN
jgi:F-type H+-transporting ATPase subunit b